MSFSGDNQITLYTSLFDHVFKPTKRTKEPCADNAGVQNYIINLSLGFRCTFFEFGSDFSTVTYVAPGRSEFSDIVQRDHRNNIRGTSRK